MKSKRIFQRLLAAVLLPCLLAGCGTSPPPQEAEDQWDPALAHVLGLSQEQRLEDYDYLVETLGSSYLCMGVRDRENPDDFSAGIFQEYRDMIAGSDSDEAFYSAVYSTLFRLGIYGHLWVVEPEEYQAYLEAYQSDELEDRAHWREVLTSPVTQTGYENLQKLLDAYGGEDASAPSAPVVEGANLTTLLLPGEAIGYIKIDGFPASYEPAYAAEREELLAFYDTLGACTDLIIDITGNSGGSEQYWQELLVAPLIDQPLSCMNYALLADSDNNRPYIDDAFAPEMLHPIADLPELPALNQEGRGGYPLCGKPPVRRARRGAQPLPWPGLGTGGRAGLLRQRVFRRVLQGDRLCHPGGQSDRRGRHRRAGPNFPAAAQQRALGAVHHDVRSERRRLQQRGGGDHTGSALPRH